MEHQPIENLLRAKVIHLPLIGDPSFGSKFNDFGKNKVVLIGSGTHGTHEFYDARSKITQYLIDKCGFDIVAVEADWPDAETIDRHVRRLPGPKVNSEAAFDRFPRWMWRNKEVYEFVEWLREHNKGLPKHRQAAFYGLDLYNLGASMEAVINYLSQSHPEMAKLARERYDKVQPWVPHLEDKPENLRAMVAATEVEVVTTLKDLLEKRLDATQLEDTEGFHSSEQNARLVSDAERYYKAMFKNSSDAWDLRAEHMFRTLNRILEHRGAGAKAVVWAHNSHAGDAKATTMSMGDVNLGRLVREKLKGDVALLGCGTYSGTVAAAREWESDVEVMDIPPSIPGSYEALAHETGLSRFFLDLRKDKCDQELRNELMATRKERYIGVVYDPEADPESNYADAILPEQFDGYIWFDITNAVKPLEIHQPKTALHLTETYPWGL